MELVDLALGEPPPGLSSEASLRIALERLSTTISFMLTVDLPAHVDKQLVAEAADRGMSPSELAATLLAESLGITKNRSKPFSFRAIGAVEVERGATHAEELLRESNFGVDSSNC